MDTVTRNGVMPKEIVVSAILRGAEIVANEKNLGRTVDLLSSVVVDLVEGKEGAKDRAISLFNVGSTYDSENVEDTELSRSISVWLNKALKATGTQQQAKRIFMLWPNLKYVTERYCHFVTPLLGGVGANTLLEESIINAVNAYQNEKNEAKKVQAYILGLAELACRLTCVSIKGRYRQGYVTWTPFSEPISDWMSRFRLKTLKTTERACSVNELTASTLLLSRILSVEDMEVANLNFIVGRVHD